MNPVYLSWTWPLFLGGTVSLALAYLGWRRSSAPGAKAFTVLMVGLALWSISDGLLLISDEYSWQVLWTKVEYIGIVLVPMAWWATAMGYTGNGRWISRRILAYASIVPFITLVLAWSFESHALIYRDFNFFRDHGVLHLDITYGLWWWISAAYAYLFLIWGAGLFLHTASRSFFLYRSQAVALLLGISLPVLGNLLHIFRVGVAGEIDFTPFTFAMAGLPLGWAIFRLGLFDLGPIARHAVMEGMRDGVVVLDPSNRVADVNPSAELILGQPSKNLIGRSVTETLGVWLGLPGQALELENVKQDLQLRVSGEERTFELNISPLAFREGGFAGRLLILQDVTAWRALGKELNTAKEEIKVLSDLLPMCAWCRQVRNDEGYWEELESYLTQRGGTEFTHGICPSCRVKVQREWKESGGGTPSSGEGGASPDGGDSPSGEGERRSNGGDSSSGEGGAEARGEDEWPGPRDHGKLFP